MILKGIIIKKKEIKKSKGYPNLDKEIVKLIVRDIVKSTSVYHCSNYFLIPRDNWGFLSLCKRGKNKPYTFFWISAIKQRDWRMSQRWHRFKWVLRLLPVTSLSLQAETAEPLITQPSIWREFAPHLFRMKHHFMLKHHPVNDSASGTSAQVSQMSDPAGGGNRWRQYFQSSTKIYCCCFRTRAVSEVVFYLCVTTMWYRSLCICEYNLYLLSKKELLNSCDNNLQLFPCITEFYFIKNWRFLLLK